MSILRFAAVGGAAGAFATIALQWAWEIVPYAGLALCAALFASAVSAGAAYVLAPSPRPALSPFFRFLGLLIYMLPRSDRKVWFLIQDDLREDAIEMRAAGYGRASICFIILWHTSVELSGVLWNRTARLAPRQIFRWVGKFIGIVIRNFIGPAK